MKRSVKLLRFLAWSALASISGLCAIFASAFLYLTPSLPAVETLKDVHLQTPLRIYTSDEKLIAEFGEKRREPVKFDDLPSDLVRAFMAAEDDRFYFHPGVDPIGLMRAFTQLVSTGRIQSGGSTITMQVAKNFFLSHERVFSRKFNEILLALQIEQELTKDEIFELYLNKIYLGNRAYGVEAAARVYYDKSAGDLTLAQMAMIAGLPKAPSRYNPINDPDRAMSRRDWILGRMKELNYITQSQYDEAVLQPITASYHHIKIDVEAPYVAEMVRQEMVERFGSDAYTEGFKVYTTVQSTLQQAANESIINGLMAYNERHGYVGPIKNLIEEGITTEEGWQAALSDARSMSILLPAVVLEVDDHQASIMLKNGQQVTLDWDNLNWAKKFININAFGYAPKKATDVLQPSDLIWVRKMPDDRYRLAQEPAAQASLVSINPNDGGILSLVGGFSFYNSMYNRANQAVRQAGSSFKPFVYSAALANGMTAATIINDAPVVFQDNGLEGVWRPNNDNMKFNGPMRLREGMFRSRNLVSIRVLRQTGVSQTVDYLMRLGFSTESLSHNLSLALGNTSVTPMELTKGYAVIANGGYQVQPYLIAQVDVMNDTVFKAAPNTVCTDCEQKEEAAPLPTSENLITTADVLNDLPLSQETPAIEVESESLPVARQVMDSRVNYLINNILEDVIWKGTGRRARALQRHDIGGKTGTSNDSKDVWFVGFNPDVLTSVWVGMDDFSTLGRWEYGANTALPIWLEFMKTALEGKPERRRVQPENMVTLKINPKTGKLAHQTDKDAIFETFRTEFAPLSVSEEEGGSLEFIEDSFSPKELF